MDTSLAAPYAARHPAPRWLLAVVAGFAAAAAIAIPTVDQPLARWLSGYRPLAFWDRTLGVLEWALGLPLVPWAMGMALAIGMVAATLRPAWRHQAPAWMFMAASHILGVIAMSRLKDLTGRWRPLEWLKHGGGPGTFWHGGVSFPSGHVVLFASVVIPLVALIPRAWPLLAVVVFAMLARLAADVHYLSDVLAGVALTSLVTWLCGYAIRPLRDRAR